MAVSRMCYIDRTLILALAYAHIVFIELIVIRDCKLLHVLPYMVFILFNMGICEVDHADLCYCCVYHYSRTCYSGHLKNEQGRSRIGLTTFSPSNLNL